MPAGFGGQSQQRWGDNTLNPNETMRDLLLTDTAGQPRATAQARKAGMLALVFFRTDCPQCRQTIALLQSLADAYADSGKLTVWGVSQDSAAATRAFAEQNGIRFPLLLDHDAWQSMNYGVTSVPTLYLVDGQGVVVQKVRGHSPATLDAVSAKVAAFLEREPVALTAPAPASPVVAAV